MLRVDVTNKLFETIPFCMKAIRTEVRSAAKTSLTVPQFRVLANINQGIKRVGELAAHHGISQPAMSRIVEGLVVRNLIKRTPNKDDRRAIELEFTSKGRVLFNRVKKVAGGELAKKMDGLSHRELAELHASLVCLQRYMKQILKVND